MGREEKAKGTLEKEGLGEQRERGLGRDFSVRRGAAAGTGERVTAGDVKGTGNSMGEGAGAGGSMAGVVVKKEWGTLLRLSRKQETGLGIPAEGSSSGTGQDLQGPLVGLLFSTYPSASRQAHFLSLYWSL